MGFQEDQDKAKLVKCRRCQSGPGFGCVTVKTGKPSYCHQVRLDDGRKAQ